MINPVIPVPYTLSEDIWMVPCIIKPHMNEFEPIAQPFGAQINTSALQRRQTWVPEEDKTLSRLVEQKGAKGWAKIARELNKRVHKGIPFRQAKQCRERYFNQLDPRLSKEKWTISEDVSILEYQANIGNKWSKIAKFLPGRTENQVKNRFKGLLIRANKEYESNQLAQLLETLNSGLEDASHKTAFATWHNLLSMDFSKGKNDYLPVKHTEEASIK